MEIAIIIVLGLLLIWAYSVYVGVIRKRNRAQEAYSGIDVQLKKRHDLIPNLLAVAKKFMTHEKELLTEITELRAAAVKAERPKDAEGIKRALKTEQDLSSKLSAFMVNVENYPQLKSDQNMLNAQNALQDVEEHIAASRRFYNSAARQLNDTVQVWPMSWIASFAKVDVYPYFETADEEKKVPSAAELLG